MRCYKVHGNGYIRFAGSQGDARQLRQNLAEDSGCGKLSFSIDQVDIPTGKEGLLAFANQLAAQADPIPAESEG